MVLLLAALRETGSRMGMKATSAFIADGSWLGLEAPLLQYLKPQMMPLLKLFFNVISSVV